MQQRYHATEITCNRVIVHQQQASKQGLSTNKFCRSIWIICTWQHQYSAPHQADHSKTISFSLEFIRMTARGATWQQQGGGHKSRRRPSPFAHAGPGHAAPPPSSPSPWLAAHEPHDSWSQLHITQYNFYKVHARYIYAQDCLEQTASGHT